MNFKQFLEMSSLRNLLKNVPQSIKYHSEGDVFAHTLLVRKAMPTAVNMFENIRNENVFSNLSPVTQDDVKLLRICAYLHDLGKNSSTIYTNPNKTQVPLADLKNKFTARQMSSPDFGPGKWQSIGHEEPQHFEPQIQQLGNQWQSILNSLSPQDREIVWYIIERHMDYTNSGFRKTIKQMVNQDGQIIADRKYKLWIVFKLMDLMGRGSGLDVKLGEIFLNDIRQMAEEKRRKNLKSPAPNTPEEFIKYLKNKGVSQDVIQNAVKNKFF